MYISTLLNNFSLQIKFIFIIGNFLQTGYRQTWILSEVVNLLINYSLRVFQVFSCRYYVQWWFSLKVKDEYLYAILNLLFSAEFLGEIGQVNAGLRSQVSTLPKTLKEHQIRHLSFKKHQQRRELPEKKIQYYDRLRLKKP